MPNLLKQAFLLPLVQAGQALSTFRYLIAYMLVLGVGLRVLSPFDNPDGDKTILFYSAWGVAFAVIYGLLLLSSAGIAWHRRIILRENVSGGVTPTRQGFLYFGYLVVVIILSAVIFFLFGMAVTAVYQAATGAENVQSIFPLILVVVVGFQALSLKNAVLKLPMASVEAPEKMPSNEEIAALTGGSWFASLFTVLMVAILTTLGLAGVSKLLPADGILLMAMPVFQGVATLYCIIVFLTLLSVFYRDCIVPGLPR